MGLDRVAVAAEPVFRLEQGDIVLAGQQPCGAEPGNARAHHSNGQGGNGQRLRGTGGGSWHGGGCLAGWGYGL